MVNPTYSYWHNPPLSTAKIRKIHNLTLKTQSVSVKKLTMGCAETTNRLTFNSLVKYIQNRQSITIQDKTEDFL